MRIALLFIFMALVTVSCAAPVMPPAGGACKYDTLDEIQAKVVALKDDRATLEGPMGKFEYSRKELGTDVKVGDELAFSGNFITKGSCVPMYYYFERKLK